MLRGAELSIGPDRLDAILDSLGRPVRRQVIATLRDARGEVSLPDLADEVAMAVHDPPLSTPSRATVERMRIALYHKHVPKLVAAGLVQFAEGERTVRLNDLEPPLVELIADI